MNRQRNNVCRRLQCTHYVYRNKFNYALNTNLNWIKSYIYRSLIIVSWFGVHQIGKVFLLLYFFFLQQTIEYLLTKATYLLLQLIIWSLILDRRVRLFKNNECQHECRVEIRDYFKSACCVDCQVMCVLFCKQLLNYTIINEITFSTCVGI